jgi:hypothetical protein
MRLHAIGKDGDMKQAMLILVILTALRTAVSLGQHLPAQQEIAPLQWIPRDAWEVPFQS